jgi:ribosomal-protein-alanine N-acetyltransferase
MTHKGTATLETERLILRPFTPGDAGAMFRNWASDPDVTEFLMWPPHGSIDISKQILAEWTANYAKPNYYLWAITLKPCDEPIGSISVIGRNEKTLAVSMGYCIGKEWWRRGITTEALKRLVAFFIEEIGVNRIDSWHDPRNPNSGKVMMKAGLKYEGTQRQADWNNTGVCDMAVYAILKEDYGRP